MLRILFRIIWKSKSVTSINVVGLTIGITIATVIFLFVREEVAYDNHNPNLDQVYRVTHDRVTNGNTNSMATTPIVLETILPEISGIERSARILRESNGVIESGDNLYNEQQFCFADPSIKDIFDFKFLRGDPKTAFQPNGLIITMKIALKYFGDKDPLGKIVVYSNWGSKSTLQVTGVIEDAPPQSHFHFNLYAQFDSPTNLWQGMHGKDWYYSGSAWTYILLKKGTDPTQIAGTINSEALKHLPGELKLSTKFFLQPLRDIHLTSDLLGEIEVNGSLSTVITFSMIGLAILLLACINYMNLATARLLERSKEVGVRKAMGASRLSLVKFYLSETLLLISVSTILAMGSMPLVLPFFNSLTGKTLMLNRMDWVLVLGITGLLVGLASGLYPSFYLSKLKPVSILKVSSGFDGARGGGLRKILVTAQYAVTSTLLISIFSVSSQMSYIQNKNLGFDKKEVVYVDGFAPKFAKALKREIKQLPEVISVTGAGGIPGSIHASMGTTLLKTNFDESNQRMEAYFCAGDHDFIDFFDMKIAAGRNFSEAFVADSIESIIVNETFVKQAGWSEPIGKEVEIFDMLGASRGKRKVIGTIKDFNFQTLHQTIKPFVLTLSNRTGNLAFRLQTKTPLRSLEKIQSMSGQFSNDRLTNVYFLDQDLSNEYTKEKRFNATIRTFTILAIVISCIGIFGLAYFSAQRKSKEIAIRKVLGASVSSIVFKFLVEFCTLVLVAFIIAAPISYFAIHEWLSAFSYRINQSPGFYLMALIASWLLSALTIAFHSIKSALVNPAQTLKEE